MSEKKRQKIYINDKRILFNGQSTAFNKYRTKTQQKKQNAIDLKILSRYNRYEDWENRLLISNIFALFEAIFKAFVCYLVIFRINSRVFSSIVFVVFGKT